MSPKPCASPAPLRSTCHPGSRARPASKTRRRSPPSSPRWARSLARRRERVRGRARDPARSQREHRNKDTATRTRERSSDVAMTPLPDRMTAVLLTGHGGLEMLKYVADYPVPLPARGEGTIEGPACGMNNTDVWVREAAYGSDDDPPAQASRRRGNKGKNTRTEKGRGGEEG